MAAEFQSAKVIVSIETILKNLDRDAKRLNQFKKTLESLATVKLPATRATSAASLDKAAASAQKLQNQQQRLVTQTQELANRQERARQATERLRQANDRLTQSQAKASRQSATAMREQRAAESLQRQRSAALIQQFREQERAAQRAAKAFENRFANLGSIFTRLGQGLSSFGATLSAALTAPLLAFSAIAVKSASDIDAQVNTLKAFVGTADAAERRLAALIATAQKTPGLTTSLALLLENQLRLANVTVDTIDKVLPAIGRLNAVSRIQDPSRFSQNLVQLVTQNFERIDLKELVGQSPLAGQIIKELFNVDSPINAEAIREAARRMGLTTTDAFFTAFAEAAARNPALAQVTESIATRFAKLVDRITIALRPLGTAIINSITPIVNFLVPIIERLGQAFASLPQFVQVLIVAFGALTAAAGPAVFVMGQMVTAVGSLVTAYARLVAVGLTPSIEGFRLLSQVMRGTAALAAGQAATTAAAAAGWAALGGAIVAGIAVLAVAAVAIASYASEQEKAIDIDKEAAAARLRRIPQIQAEVKDLEALTHQQELSAEQQERLRASYEDLSGISRGRIAVTKDEAESLRVLIELKREQLRLDQFEANATAVQAVKNLTLALAEQQAAQGELAAATREFNEASTAAIRNAQQFGQFSSRQEEVFARQERASLRAAAALEEIQRKGEGVESAAKFIQALADAAEISTEQLLQMAAAAGTNAAAIDEARKAIEKLIPEQQELATVVAEANKELIAQNEALEELENDPTVVIAKSADKALRSVLEFIKANTNSTEDARRALENYIQLFPQLAKAVERAGGIDAVIESLTKAPGKKSETSIRNAREQLTNALLRVAEAEIEAENTVRQLGNEKLLQANENAYRLELIGYRDYLTARANLTNENLRLEIAKQNAIVLAARKAQARLLALAIQLGGTSAEAVRRRAQAAAEEEKAIQAQTRITELEAERDRNTDELGQALAEARKEQIETVRALDIEFAELTGRIADALEARTVDRFRESLALLGKEQKTINDTLIEARANRDADTVAQLESARNLNQEQIDLIELIIGQERATNKLVVEQRSVEEAKQRQAELERQIAFDVEFRGETEQRAIERRLAGEAKLADSLRLSRDLIEEQINALNAQALPVPKALLDFIREINLSIQGLGELPFSEQFRLAEQEFNRINDERIRKIGDVERAIRNRDIAEAEGRILIKRINGEYVADLEKQLALLKQIAAASGQEGLRRQAEDAEETVKDTKDELASLSRQLESTGKDAFRSGLATFFTDLVDSSRSALEDLKSFLDSLVQSINEVIAENLADQLFESLFGGEQGEGLISRVLGFLGLGGGQRQDVSAIGAEHAVEAVEHTAAATALTTGATTAAGALISGGTAASAALTTGGASAGASLVASVTTAAAAFAAQVAAAGAAFAASVAASSASSAVGGLGALLGAETGIFPAVPGGLYRFVEGGYPEAVLTTDPKHAARQVGILRDLLQRTKGFYGRVPELASGGFVSRETAELNLLNSIVRAPQVSPALPGSVVESAGGAGLMNLRIINQFVTREVMRPYVTSEEFSRDVLNVISKNSNEVARRLPIRGR